MKDSDLGGFVLGRPSISKTDPPLPPRFPIRVPLFGAAVASLIALGIAIHLGKVNFPAPSPTASPESVSNVSDPQATARVARARFYDTAVTPLIAEVDAKNREAAERCLESLEDLLRQYHEGVQFFVDDMTSISTRLGVIKRLPGGWWAGDTRVEDFVQDKFEEHLFSEQQLVTDLSGVLLQFRDEVNANQLWMLTRVQAALTTADLPGVGLEQRDDFFRELSNDLGSYAADQGTASVENMLGAFVLGEVGAFAGRSIIAALLVRFAPSIAIGSAATASATVGASATGAGGGSFGGPVGTVVGFGAGLAIGLVIDWWMTERFEAELSRQMHVYLYDLETTLISGGSLPDETTKSPGEEKTAAAGLASALPRLCDQLRNAYRDRFFQQIVDGESS